MTTTDAGIAGQEPGAAMDTRVDFRLALDWVQQLVDGVRPDQLDLPTPCADWTVRQLLGHLVGVLHRLRAIGQGADPMTVPATVADRGALDWRSEYRAGRAGWEEAWSDDAVLSRELRAPFGAMPGAQVLGGYIVEYLVHGWDLAVATGQRIDAPADVAERALGMARVTIPAERRGPGVPFKAPVEPAEGADSIERLANWLGRAA